MHMGINFMFDILVLHSKYVYLLFFQMLKNCESIVEKICMQKVFWMHEWRVSLEQFFGVMNHREGTAKRGFFGYVFVFCFEPHTHTLKLEKCVLEVLGYVLSVHGFVFWK